MVINDFRAQTSILKRQKNSKDKMKFPSLGSIDYIYLSNIFKLVFCAHNKSLTLLSLLEDTLLCMQAEREGRALHNSSVLTDAVK